MKHLGLIGNPVAHSFSEKYFAAKFKALGIQNFVYKAHRLESVNEVHELIGKHQLLGFNVTIPFKELIIPHLDELKPSAKEIGAVNTVVICHGKLKGYNTDWVGFKNSLEAERAFDPSLPALILGTGGSAKAVKYALDQLEVPSSFVSRQRDKGHMKYADLIHADLSKYGLIVNCTPCGMHPNLESTPPIPIEKLSSRALVYDLVYNPEKTKLLQLAEKNGCATKNGYDMLCRQADASWGIWLAHHG